MGNKKKQQKNNNNEKMCIKHDCKNGRKKEKKLMPCNYETIKNPLASKCFHSLMFIHQKIPEMVISTINNGRSGVIAPKNAIAMNISRERQ
jgi:hypothetical protein